MKALKLRRDSELQKQVVSRPMRVVCGLVGAGMLGMGIYGLLVSAESLSALSGVFGFGVFFTAVAVFGFREPVIAPRASERFIELADPARPLPPAAAHPASPGQARDETHARRPV